MADRRLLVSAPVIDSPAEPVGRTARKRTAIVEAATGLFLRQGYADTSMDQVAALAAVSKQTVYKQFTDKEHLFRECVMGVSGTIDRFVADMTSTLRNTTNLEDDLQALARRYVHAVMQPRILQLRRLVIGEGSRFAGLGRTYFEEGPQRVISELASSFKDLSDRGLLEVPDSWLAGNQFAYLVLSIPLDRALICGEAEVPRGEELDRIADGATRVFLAAYRPR
jgi:TetR/AcrR family transcriptional repressor of mexJK operon